MGLFSLYSCQGLQTDRSDNVEVVWHKPTSHGVEASLVQYPREHFKTNDGINDNDKQHKKSDVKQRNHGHQDRIDDDL